MVFSFFASVADELHSACAMFRLCHASYNLNFSGFEGALSAPCVGVVNAAFFGFRALGFKWCLAFSHPLPTGFLFASVADERHIQVMPCSGCAMLNLSGFGGALSAACVGVMNAFLNGATLATGYFMTQLVVGHVFPSGLLCLLCILPFALADCTCWPHVGHAWAKPRATTPFRTRNCFPQCPDTFTFPDSTVL